MMRQQKNKIQAALICGLLMLSTFDFGECRKTSSNNKNKSKQVATQRPKTSNTQTHANPQSFSYGNVNPSAPQQPKPSAPVQQPIYPSQQRPAFNQPPPNTNTRPIGFNDQNQPRPQSPPYPVNQPKPNAPPYPMNNQHNSPPYPGNNPPPHSQFPNQAAPPIYAQNPSQNFNNQQQPFVPSHQGHPQPGYQQPPPAYHPQPGYQQPPPAYHPQPGYQQPPPAYNPQPQVVHHIVQPAAPVQQSGGPGLLKTAVVAGAAGLGGAALYNVASNAFKSDDPKTTVIYVNNTQPAAAPPAPEVAAPAPQVPVPAQNPPVQAAPEQYPQQTYPQQTYPQQTYPQDQYPQNQYPQQQYPQNQYPQQQYPNQYPQPQAPVQYDPNQAPTVAPPIVGETTVANASNAETSTVVSGESTTLSPASQESTTAGSTTITDSNGVSPINALNSRAEETVELRSSTHTHQSAPITGENKKASNSVSPLQYSIVMLSLSVVYQMIVKSLF
jgi:hypothetical protein